MVIVKMQKKTIVSVRDSGSRWVLFGSFVCVLSMLSVGRQFYRYHQSEEVIGLALLTTTTDSAAISARSMMMATSASPQNQQKEEEQEEEEQKEQQEQEQQEQKEQEQQEQQEQQHGQPRPQPLQCSDIQSMPPIRSIEVTNRCVPDHHFPQRVHSLGDIVSREIRLAGCWEPRIVQSIVNHFGTDPQQYDPHPRTFIDVGGNIGVFTTTIANLGHPVITVEPFRLNVPLILQTLCSTDSAPPGGLDNVKLFKVALSDKSPGQKMCLWSTHSQLNNGNARLVPYFEGQKDFGQDKNKTCMEAIHSYTLDELLGLSPTLNPQQHQPPVLSHRPWGMKMDIEGYETLALRGAQNLLMTPSMAPCRIWFEYQRAVTMESGAGAEEIFGLLEQAGYSELFVTDDAKEWTSVPQQGPFPVNGDFMAIHKDSECHPTSSGGASIIGDSNNGHNTQSTRGRAAAAGKRRGRAAAAEKKLPPKVYSQGAVHFTMPDNRSLRKAFIQPDH